MKTKLKNKSKINLYKINYILKINILHWLSLDFPNL